ncbi:MAG: glycoside hydrolase family 3 N-terminal domain-containing protein [Victivallaceae bacterium]|nr:glycoside hydrolase family 3 N-terminal domain-containing protein [Victivallaceae bacterium]
MLGTKVRSPLMPPDFYAAMLNEIRRPVFERRELGLPLHIVTDCESGGGDYSPPFMISMPNAMGFGDLGDLDLLERSWYAMGEQLKAVGIDWLHSPVVDVNVNPLNPEISVRAFGKDAEVTTRCAAASIRGMKRAGMISTLKHFPGRGDSVDDAHFGLPCINASYEDMMNIHIRPYAELIRENMVQSVMLAHSLFPSLDPSKEVATVSEKIIRGVLREELGFNGVITTDSLTMGGLMARYSVSEACILAINCGVDLMLLKTENALRFELHRDLVNAVKSRRIKESTIDASLLRIWKLKHANRLFENGGKVNPAAAAVTIQEKRFQDISREASRKVMRVMRLEDGTLPLKPKQNILIVDRVTDLQLRRNDYWNYPGMLFNFMRNYTENLGYVDYDGKTISEAQEKISQIIEHVDVIVVTTDFNRNDPELNSRAFVSDLTKPGKTVIQISSSPIKELCIPDEVKNVIITYGVMREQLQCVAEFLFTGQSDRTNV